MNIYKNREKQMTTTTLTYRQLQESLRPLKKQGLTTIKLNAKYSVLQEEYDRLTNLSTIKTKKSEKILTSPKTFVHQLANSLPEGLEVLYEIRYIPGMSSAKKLCATIPAKIHHTKNGKTWIVFDSPCVRDKYGVPRSRVDFSKHSACVKGDFITEKRRELKEKLTIVR